MWKHSYYALGKLAAHLQRRHPLGRNIYEADWDICIILDSARADLFASVAPGILGYDSDSRIGILTPGRAWSVGSITTEWLANTYRPRYREEIADTTLVSATPHSTTVFDDREWLTNADSIPIDYPPIPTVDRDAFSSMHELWRSHCGSAGVVEPATMRDATLQAHHETTGRVVAHWMQPHEPFIAPGAEIVGGGATERNVWEGLQSGRLASATVWQSYRKNLEYCLPFVREVLENVEGRVLITADHGNAFGGLGVYGHPFAWPQPAVRRVPWCVIDCEDSGTASYDTILDEHQAALAHERADAQDVETQLRALGYR